MSAHKWPFVYTRDSKPLAAFCDLALAEAYVLKEPEQNEQIVMRNFTLGGQSELAAENQKLRQLLRDIVSNDYSLAGDTRMIRAICEAREKFGIKNF